MFSVDEPGFLFTAGTIGNSVSDVVDGRRVLDGSVAYPLGHTETRVLAVIGHTGCGAVGAALTAARTGEFPTEPGVRADVEALLPIVEAGLESRAVVDADAGRDDGSVGNAGDDASVRDRLVEYNVHEQVAFAIECEETVDATVYGLVYDFHGVYGDRDGAVYLVNADGERDPAALRDLVGDAHADHVATLL
jgi:carbonic anhydrase